MSLSLLVWLYVSLIASVDADWSQAPHNSFKERVPGTGNGFSQDSRTLGDIIFDVYANNASMPSLLERMLADSGVKPSGGGQHKVGFQPGASQPPASRANLTQHTRKGLPRQASAGRPDPAKPAREDLGYAEKELQLFHQIFEEYLHFKAHRKGVGVVATRRGLEETCEKILGRKNRIIETGREELHVKDQAPVGGVETDSTVVLVDDGYQGRNSTKPPQVDSKEEEAFSSFETLVKAMLSPFSQLPTAALGDTNTRFPDDVTVVREDVDGNASSAAPAVEITETASGPAGSQTTDIDLTSGGSQAQELSPPATVVESAGPAGEVTTVVSEAQTKPPPLAATSDVFSSATTVKLAEDTTGSVPKEHISTLGHAPSTAYVEAQTHNPPAPSNGPESFPSSPPYYNPFQTYGTPTWSKESRDHAFSVPSRGPQLQDVPLSSQGGGQYDITGLSTGPQQFDLPTTPSTGSHQYGLPTPSTGSHQYSANTPLTGPQQYGANTPLTGPQQYGANTPLTGPQQYGFPTPSTGSQQYDVPTPSIGSQLYDFATPSTGPQQYGFPTPSTGSQQYGFPALSTGSQLYDFATPSRGPQQHGLPNPSRGPQQYLLPSPSKGPEEHDSPSPLRGPQQHGSPSPSKGPQKHGPPTPTEGPQQHSFPTKGPQKRSQPSSTKAPKKHGSPSSSKSPKKHGTQGTTALQPDYTATTQIASGNESSFLLTGQPSDKSQQAPKKKGRSHHARALLRNLVLPAEDIEKLYLIEESARRQRTSATTTEPQRLKIKIRHQETTEEAAEQEEAKDEKEVEEAVEAVETEEEETETSSQSDIPVLENLMKNLNQQFSKRVPTKEDIVNIQDAISRLNAVLSQSSPENASHHSGLSPAPRPSTWKVRAEPRPPTPQLRLKPRPKPKLEPEPEPEPEHEPEEMLTSKAPSALGGAHFLPQAIFYSQEKPGKKTEPREEPLEATTYRSPLRAERPLSERKGAREEKKASAPRKELHLSAPDVFPKIDQLEQLLKKAKVRFSKGSPTPGDMLHLKTAMNHLDAIVPGDKNLSRSKRSLRSPHHRYPAEPGSSVSHFILPSDSRGPNPGPPAKRRARPLHAFPPNAREHRKPSSSSSSSTTSSSVRRPASSNGKPSARHAASLGGRLSESAQPARRDPDAPSPISTPKGAKRNRAGKKSNASVRAPSPVSHGQPSPSKLAPAASIHPRRDKSKEHIIRRASMFSPAKGHASPVSKRSLPSRPPGKLSPERHADQHPRFPTVGPRPVPLANPREREDYRPPSLDLAGKKAAAPRRVSQGSSKSSAQRGPSGPQGLRLNFATRENRNSFLEKRRQKALSSGTQESRLQSMVSPNSPQKSSVANPSHRIHAPSPEKTRASNPSRGLNAPSGKNVRSSKTPQGPDPPTPEKVWSSKPSYRHPPPSLKSRRPTIASRSFEAPSLESAKSLRLSQKRPASSPENRRSSGPSRRRGPPSPENEPLPKTSLGLNPPSPKRSKSSRPPLRLPPSAEDRESSQPPLKRGPRLPGDRRASNPSHNLKFTPPGKRQPSIRLPASREKGQLSSPPSPEIASPYPLKSFKKSSRANSRSSNPSHILKPTSGSRNPSIGPSLPAAEDRRSSKLPNSLQKSSTGTKKSLQSSNNFNPSSVERESPNPSHFSTPSPVVITKSTRPSLRLKPISAGHRRSSKLPHGRRPVSTGTRKSTNPSHGLHKSSKPSHGPTPSSTGTMKSTGPPAGLSPSSTRPTDGSPPSSTGSRSSVSPQSHNSPPLGTSNTLKDPLPKAPLNTESPLPSIVRMSAGSREKPLKLPNPTNQPPLWKGKFSKLFYNPGDFASVRKRFHGPNISPPVNELEGTPRSSRQPSPKRQDRKTPPLTPAPAPKAAMAKRPSDPSPGPRLATTTTIVLVEHESKTVRVHHVHALKTPRDRSSFFGLTTSTAPVVEEFLAPSTTTTRIPLLEEPTTTPSEDIEIIILPTTPTPTPIDVLQPTSVKPPPPVAPTRKRVPHLHRHSSATTLSTEPSEDQVTSDVTFIEIPEPVSETEAAEVPDAGPPSTATSPAPTTVPPLGEDEEEEEEVTLPTKIVPRVHHHIHSLVTPASHLSFLRVTTPKPRQVLLNYTRTSTTTPTSTSVPSTSESSTKKPPGKKNKHKGSKKASSETSTPEAEAAAAAESSTTQSEHHKAASGSAKQKASKSHRNKAASNIKSKKTSWGSPNPSAAQPVDTGSSTPSPSDPPTKQSPKAAPTSELSSPTTGGPPVDAATPTAETRRPQTPPMNELVIQASFPSQSSPLTKRPVPRYHSSRPRPSQPAADQPSPAATEPEDEELEELEELEDFDEPGEPAPPGPDQGFPQLLRDPAEPYPIGTPEPADGQGEGPEVLSRRARRVGTFAKPRPPAGNARAPAAHPAEPGPDPDPDPDPGWEEPRLTRVRRTKTEWVADQPGVEEAI